MAQQEEGGTPAAGGGGRAGSLPQYVFTVLQYRKAAIAVVSVYLGLEDAFVEAVLADQMDEYLAEQAEARERMKAERYDDYVALLGKEVLVRYAATAAETLAQSPERALFPGPVQGEAGLLGLTDDVNAMVRVHEIFEYLEAPDAGEEADALLLTVKRQLCGYYNACAHDLVKAQLLPVIIATAEEVYRGHGPLTAPAIRDRIIAGQGA